MLTNVFLGGKLYCNSVFRLISYQSYSSFTTLFDKKKIIMCYAKDGSKYSINLLSTAYTLYVQVMILVCSAAAAATVSSNVDNVQWIQMMTK